MLFAMVTENVVVILIIVITVDKMATLKVILDVVDAVVPALWDSTSHIDDTEIKALMLGNEPSVHCGY
jgi:hypothetical protein